MPLRKEPKEAVVYPASKRKAPAFIPQRPPKVSRTSTTESEGSRSAVTERPARNVSAGFQTTLSKPRPNAQPEDRDDEVANAPLGAMFSDSDEELSNPLDRRSQRTASLKPGNTAKRPPTRPKSPIWVSSQDDLRSSPPPADPATAYPMTQLSESTQIPQPLLVRLLHEHFADNSTKIDKHAIQILQKYMEIFVRESVARTALAKKEAADAGIVDADDASWLEVEDLEKVAGGLMLDFC